MMHICRIQLHLTFSEGIVQYPQCTSNDLYSFLFSEDTWRGQSHETNHFCMIHGPTSQTFVLI